MKPLGGFPRSGPHILLFESKLNTETMTVLYHEAHRQIKTHAQNIVGKKMKRFRQSQTDSLNFMKKENVHPQLCLNLLNVELDNEVKK